jgi:protein ImuB
MPRAASTLALNVPLAGPRLLALHVPDLPLQRLARGREAGGDRPVAVVWEGRVCCCDAAALEAGVRPGQALAEALAACGRLEAVPHAPAADLGALRALAEALLAVAPAVEVAGPDALLLDASAAHLLHGPEPEPERRLLARARALAGELGFTVRAAAACGRGPALALARHGARGEPLLQVPPGEEPLALSALPLAALGLGPAVVEQLRSVGVDGVGALARLPVEGLALRFGAAGAAAARLARGDDPTPLSPYFPATLPEEAIELEGPADGAEPVLFVLKRLADRVAARLAGRGLGASRLTVTLRLDPRGEERLSIPLAHPSASSARWMLAWRDRLLALRLPGAVVGVKLAAVEVALVDEVQLALGDRPEAQAALETVLARLSGRLGDGAVVAAEPVARYRPEAAWHPVPFQAPARQPGALARPSGAATGSPGAPAGAVAARRTAAEAGPSGSARLRHVGETERQEVGAAQRPTRLLAEPRPLVATGEGGRVSTIRLGAEVHAVLSFEGPERLRGEWWSAPFDRDYYRARVEGLGDCWIYRDGADGRLHLHGFFD